MGFLDGDFFGGTSSNYGGTSRQRSRSNTRSTSGRSGHYARQPNSRSSSSYFGGAGGNHNSSRGFFSSTGSGGSSHYKRRPRDGYISYLVHRLQRLIRELWQYFRRHPVKAFFAVIVPLISAGGAIGGLMKAMGFRIPAGLGSVFGDNASSRGGGGGYYGSRGYGGSSSAFDDIFGGGAGGGMMDNAGHVLKIAKMFM
jgi:hypothetical protein